MTIMSAQAVAQRMHKQDSPQDIVIFVAIEVALLALLPAKTSITGRRLCTSDEITLTETERIAI